jgi:hypothetical protein
VRVRPARAAAKFDRPTATPTIQLMIEPVSTFCLRKKGIS